MEPFQKLYGNVLRWQRAEKRWMDGEFLKLESEAIEGEVDEFWREIYKGLSGNFVNRIVLHRIAGLSNL